MDKKTVIVLVFFITLFLILFTFLLLDSNEENNAEVIFHTDSNGITFYCKIADDDSEKRKGLLDVESLPQNEGMLFLYSDSDMRWFTMKDMKIPLDIIFVNKNYNVVNVVEANIDEEHISSIYPAKYVIEINQGLSSEFGIKEGIRVDIFKKNN